MQASKIQIGQVYAIADADKEYVRFKATVVITRRSGNAGPNAYSSMVEGYLDYDDNGGKRGETLTLHPDKILGPYLEFTVLKEREAAERAAAHALAQARQDKVDEVRRLLYGLIGQPVPGETRNEAFATSYGFEMRISEPGIEALLPVLRKLSNPALPIVADALEKTA